MPSLQVLAEIRDKNARERLASLPFELKVRVPSDESLCFGVVYHTPHLTRTHAHTTTVVNFAKKTGDFVSLSAADLRVLALAYMLEVEHNGAVNIKAEPVTPTACCGCGSLGSCNTLL